MAQKDIESEIAKNDERIKGMSVSGAAIPGIASSLAQIGGGGNFVAGGMGSIDPEKRKQLEEARKTNDLLRQQLDELKKSKGTTLG